MLPDSWREPSALLTGVTAPTPRPSSGATRTKTVRLSLRKISGSAVAQSKGPLFVGARTNAK